MIKEIIEKENVNIEEILYIIEQYILEKKNVKVKINTPNNVIRLKLVMHCYEEYAAPYFMQKEKV